MSRTLIVAIGNAGRGDDGLGWAFAEAAEAEGFPPEDIHVGYQLQVEDAATIAQASRVIFVDASREALPDGFALRPIGPAAEFSFTTHGVSPEAILFLARELYGSRPEAWMLAIAGEAWEIGTGLSAGAERNLRRALRALDPSDAARSDSPPNRGRPPSGTSGRG